MGAPYQSQTASGYNSSPPADDGTVSAANKVKWSTIKTQLGDPAKGLADNINTEIRTALNVAPTAQSSAYTTTTADHLRPIEVTGTTTISLGDAATMVADSMGYEVTIVNRGVATVTVSRVTGADTLNGAAKDIKLAPGQAVVCAVNSTSNGYNVRAVANGVLFDPTDPSKQARFAVSGVTAGQQRVITVPDSDTKLPIAAQQLTISGPTAARTLTLPDEDFTINATTLPDIQEFTSPGTWTKPAGAKIVKVVLVGGGGGGGGAGSGSANNKGAGGGGSGGAVIKWYLATALGATETVTLGAAGSAGTTAPADGGAGGNSTFKTLTAGGGSGGVATNTSGRNGVGGAGGTAAGGDLNYPGQAGSPGASGDANEGSAGGGNGGSALWFMGGGKGQTNEAGTAGTFGGGGGGAAATTVAKAGGAGSVGYAVITSYF